MPQVAYDLEYFAPAQQAAPKMRVVKRGKAPKNTQLLKMVGVLATVVVLVGLVCAVLYTQVTINELQGQITSQRKALAEADTLNFYLTFEMSNMTTMKGVEERAKAMGLEKVNSNQVVYYRVEDTGEIKVKESPVVQLVQSAKSSVLDIWDYFAP